MIGREVGNFRIVRELGRGGMGTVFEGLDLMLDRRVAIKVLNVEVANDTQFVARFRKEAKALARLDHPNVTAIYTFFAEENELFLVMELVEGEPLDDVQKRHGKLPWTDAVPIACALLDGLAHAHQQGIVHRDIKPGNCLLSHNGGVKVTDFGIAHIVGEQRLTRMGSIIGTVEYMSPEQIQGQDLDPRSDVYSLGLVLYELLTGRVPFPGGSEFEVMRAQLEAVPEPPSKLAEGLPAWLESGTLRALAKLPEERFQSAADFAAALRQGLESSGIQAVETASGAVQISALAGLPPLPGAGSQEVAWPGGVRPDAPTLEAAASLETAPTLETASTLETAPTVESRPGVAHLPEAPPSSAPPPAGPPPPAVPPSAAPPSAVSPSAASPPVVPPSVAPPPPSASAATVTEPARRSSSRVITLVTVGLLAMASLIVAVALLRPGKESEPPEQLAQQQEAVPAPPRSLSSAPPAGSSDAPPERLSSVEPRPRATMQTPTPSSSPPPSGASPPVRSRATEPRATAPTSSQRSPELKDETAPELVDPEENLNSSDVPEQASSASPSEVSPAETSSSTPLSSGDLLAALDPLAEELQFECNLLLESFEELLGDRDPPDASPDWKLAERLEVLEVATNRLQRAYDQIAYKEGNGIKRRRFIRMIKAQAGNLVSGADRQKVLTRAEQAVSAGKRVRELVTQVELDSATRSLWQKVRSKLNRLERLVHQAK